MIGIEMRPSADGRLELLDALETGAHEFLRGDLALANGLGGLDGAQENLVHSYFPNKASGSHRAIPGKLYINTMAKITMAR
jgi:hypothetical protein